MTPNRNDPGTAWYFTVNAELNECPDTGVLNIEAASEKFEDSDNDGDCDADGTVYIGRSDGTSQLIRAEDATAEHDDEKLRVSNGVVYALVNNVSQPLFKGDFSLPFTSPAIGSVTETDEVSNDFTIAGLEIEFSKLRLDRNQVELEGDFTLPNALGAFDISLSAPNALIISNYDIRIEGGNISFPTEEFRLFDSFEIKAEDAAIGYFPVNDELKIQGKFALVTPFFRSDPDESSGASIVLDILGSNYLKISDGLADINGDFSLKNIGLGDRWSINELTLSLAAENG